MKAWEILVALASIVLVGGAGFVIGSQDQQLDLGLEQALPESRSVSDSQDASPGIPVSGNAVFRVVGEQGDYVLVVLMIKQGDTWRPAKIQSSTSGFEYVAGE